MTKIMTKKARQYVPDKQLVIKNELLRVMSKKKNDFKRRLKILEQLPNTQLIALSAINHTDDNEMIASFTPIILNRLQFNQWFT